MIRLAIQKSGRLADKTLKLLHECSLNFDNGGQAKLRVNATNFPMQILFIFT